MSKYYHIMDFGESLRFTFVTEGGYCYPSIGLEGPQGTSAELFGHHMTKAEILLLAQKLKQFAEEMISS